MKNVQTRDIILLILNKSSLVFLFSFFLSNKAQSSMESAWQRVESMHRWILENGGMIPPPPHVIEAWFIFHLIFYCTIYTDKRYIIKYEYNL